MVARLLRSFFPPRRSLRSSFPRIHRQSRRSSFSRVHRKDDALLNDQSNGPDYFKFPMASCGRSYFVKAALLAGTLLVLLNLYNYKFESNTTPSSMSPAQGSFSEQWPRLPISHSTQQPSANSSQSIDNATHVAAHSDNATFSTTNTSISQGDISLVQLNSSHSNQSLKMSAITSNASTDNLHSVENSTKPQIVSTLVLNNCPPTPPNLVGPINVSTTIEDMRVVESRFIQKLLPGGWYKPKECKAKERVAIIVPFRNRSDHIPVFFANIHPFLMKQQIEYGIFLVEQVKGELFNRATLMNVGFVESQKLADWDCFIFHDIDLLPMDDRNLYNCPDQPRHMSVAVDTLGFKLSHDKIFGGVSALTKQQFQKLNGFSNQFWGWGGEDDDLGNRVTHAGYHITRYPTNIARYYMIKHKKETPSPVRHEKLAAGKKIFDVEGLNTLEYKMQYLEKKILYTWMLVDIKRNEVGNSTR